MRFSKNTREKYEAGIWPKGQGNQSGEYPPAPGGQHAAGGRRDGTTGGRRKARACSQDTPLAGSAPGKGRFGQDPKEGNQNSPRPMRSWNLERKISTRYGVTNVV